MEPVDVITVNYHSEDVLLGLIASLTELASRRDGVRVIVVDCGGLASAPVELGSGAGLPVVVIDAGGNVGFGAAVNLGLAAATAEVVVLANPDLALDADALDDLLNEGAGSEAVAWTGVLRNEDGSVQLNTAPPPALHRHLAEYLLSIETRLPPADTAREVPVITGALVCARTRAVREIGGMDERYPLYVEDVDFCVRLAKVGRLMQFPIEVATHTGGVSAGRVRRPADLEVLVHASWVAWFRRRSRWEGGVERVGALLGCAARRSIRRGPAIDLRLLFRATAPGYDLRSLLPTDHDHAEIG